MPPRSRNGRAANRGPKHHRAAPWTAQPTGIQAASAWSFGGMDAGIITAPRAVRRVGEINFSVVQRYVNDVVALPDRDIFEAMIWVMERCKLVVEGAAAAPVAALLHGLVDLPKGSRVV